MESNNGGIGQGEWGAQENRNNRPGRSAPVPINSLASREMYESNHELARKQMSKSEQDEDDYWAFMVHVGSRREGGRGTIGGGKRKSSEGDARVQFQEANGNWDPAKICAMDQDEAKDVLDNDGYCWMEKDNAKKEEEGMDSIDSGFTMSPEPAGYPNENAQSPFGDFPMTQTPRLKIKKATRRLSNSNNTTSVFTGFGFEIKPQQFEPQQFQPKQFEPQQFQPQPFEPQQFEPQQFEPQQFEPQQFAPQQFAPQQFQQQQPFQQLQQFRQLQQFQQLQTFQSSSQLQ